MAHRQREKLKIGIVTEYFYPYLGGITENVLNFSINAMKEGCDITVITSHIKGEDKVKVPFKVVRIGRSIPIYGNDSFGRVTLGFCLGKQLRRFFEENRFDILHLHSPLTPTLPMLTLRYAPYPKVGTFHTHFEKSRAYVVWHRFVQRMMYALDGRIFVSEIARASMEKYFDVPEGVIIPNGVDTNKFRRIETKKNGKIILFIGRFDPRNNIHILIEAFKGVKKEVRDAKLYVVGYSMLEQKYISMVPDYLSKDVIFLGRMDEERPFYYSLADVTCYPVDRASFGVTLLESMATGTPLVVSDLVSFRELASENEAIFVKPGDVIDLKNGLIKILKDDALRKQMSESCLKRVSSYSWEKVTRRILDYYDRVLSRKNATKNKS